MDNSCTIRKETMNHVEQLCTIWEGDDYRHMYPKHQLARELRAAIAADKAEAEKAESVAAKMTQHHTSNPLNERTQLDPEIVTKPAVWQCPVCQQRYQHPGSCVSCEFRHPGVKGPILVRV